MKSNKERVKRMPRLSKSQHEKQNDNIRYVIAGNLEKLRIGKYEFASKIGFGGYATFLKRWKSPDEFTLGDLRRIANVVNISLNTLLGNPDSNERARR